MMGHLPLMPVEEDVRSWRTISWKDGVTREELLIRQIEHFSLTRAKVDEAIVRMREARLKNKHRFDKSHRIRPRPIEVGDWVLLYESNLENQHSSEKKFARRWRGPFVVTGVFANATYMIRELDGTALKGLYAGKRIKVYKQRQIGGGNVLEKNAEELEEVDDYEEGKEESG
ncbi:unnamed protein product [Calypogeia fissa]